MLVPKNWSSFQHYKDRAPAWIKLHKRLLDDYEFSCLQVASRALAPMLWLLASEYDGGKITASTAEISFRLRMTEADLIDAVKPLIQSGFFECDSELLADCKHDAITEKKEEEEVENKIQDKNAALTRALVDDGGEAVLFHRGKEILGSSAGGLIVRLLKSKGGSIPLARSAIELASTKQDPREYIGRVIAGEATGPPEPGIIDARATGII
jgi:hypothetical protein